MPCHPPVLEFKVQLLCFYTNLVTFSFCLFITCLRRGHFTAGKTELLEPWTVPVALSAMNKPCRAIVMKESASPTHRYTGSEALSVEPVSQHWLPVVILSRDWSWQSLACQTQNPVYLSRRAAVAHYSLPALPVSSLGRQSLRQHEDRKTCLIGKLAVPSTLLTPRSLVSCGLPGTAEAQTQKTRFDFHVLLEEVLEVNSDFLCL